MQVARTFEHTKFPFGVIFDAVSAYETESDIARASVEMASQEVAYDSLAEAMNDYQGDCLRLNVHAGSMSPQEPGISIYYSYNPSFRDRSTKVTVRAPTRAEIEKVLQRFEERKDAAYIEPPAKPAPLKRSPSVFIGHGGSPLWRDVKDHLADQHDYRIEAYETGARAGHQIRDILQSMTKASSFAILVMTGEDEQPSGAVRARQNVVHEVGLFQGALGFDRAIVLFEEGTEEFSNLHGIQQVRFPKGRIRETFGDVLATLRREFGTDR